MAEEATASQPSLRVELRRARVQAGLTQTQLADALGCRQARINKIESGQTRSIPPKDLQDWLDVCGVPPAQAEKIKSLALVPDPAAPRGWVYSPAIRKMMDLEERATEILVLRSERLPRVLQDARYLLKQFKCAGVLEHPSALLAEREARAEIFLRQPPVPYRCLLSESSLHRLPGGHDAGLMIDQLTYLLRLMADYEHVSVQILTYAASIPWLDSDFTVLKFDSELKDVVYAEFASQGRIYEGDGLVEERERYWHQLQREALSREDSIAHLQDLLGRVRAGWRPQPDA